ncbi:MAG: PA2779 family protein [Pseudomonadota bacterium]
MQRWLKTAWARRITILLVFTVGVISLVPPVDASFISSLDSFSSPLREKDMAVVQKALESKMVINRLKALGYTEDEITARLHQLPDDELHRLASRIDTLVPAGDGLGVIIALLVIVLLVVVILVVADKRIIIK